MAECEKLPNCPFFYDKMDNMPAMAGILKRKYCLGSNRDCARYAVFCALGSEHVPSDLYPGDTDYAKQLVG